MTALIVTDASTDWLIYFVNDASCMWCQRLSLFILCLLIHAIKNVCYIRLTICSWLLCIVFAIDLLNNKMLLMPYMMIFMTYDTLLLFVSAICVDSRRKQGSAWHQSTYTYAHMFNRHWMLWHKLHVQPNVAPNQATIFIVLMWRVIVNICTLTTLIFDQKAPGSFICHLCLTFGRRCVKLTQLWRHWR